MDMWNIYCQQVFCESRYVWKILSGIRIRDLLYQVYIYIFFRFRCNMIHYIVDGKEQVVDQIGYMNMNTCCVALLCVHQIHLKKCERLLISSFNIKMDNKSHRHFEKQQQILRRQKTKSESFCISIKYTLIYFFRINKNSVKF